MTRLLWRCTVPQDYEDLLRSGISVQPVVNQIEVSPLMYRPDTIEYFQRRGIVIAASKALNRGGALQLETVCKLADKYNVTSASILIRWAVQKNLVVITKSSNPGRMVNNRDVFQFSISADDMSLLDDMTTKEAIEEREVVEASRKTSQ